MGKHDMHDKVAAVKKYIIIKLYAYSKLLPYHFLNRVMSQ